MGTVSKDLNETVHRIAFQDIRPGKLSNSYQSDPLLARLKELGSELWIDTGDLELAQSIWKNELTALTTNNTLANQVVQSGIMDGVIQETVDKLAEAASGLSRGGAGDGSRLRDQLPHRLETGGGVQGESQCRTAPLHFARY